MERSAPGLRLLSRPRLSRGFGRRADVRGVCCWWVWMVVRFVCVVRGPLCGRVSRVSRVCPGSPGVFLPYVPAPPGVFLPVCPVCVPAPPGVFLPVRYSPEWQS